MRRWERARAWVRAGLPRGLDWLPVVGIGIGIGLLVVLVVVIALSIAQPVPGPGAPPPAPESEPPGLVESGEAAPSMQRVDSSAPVREETLSPGEVTARAAAPPSPTTGSPAVAQVIDAYLARRNSPLAGCGAIFAEEGLRTGINPYLPVAIAGVESSFGLYCFAPHNAWGMLAYRAGFRSWEEGIRANFAWLARYYGAPQGARDCPGYCVPNHPWMEKVQSIIQDLERLESHMGL